MFLVAGALPVSSPLAPSGKDILGGLFGCRHWRTVASDHTGTSESPAVPDGDITAEGPVCYPRAPVVTLLGARSVPPRGLLDGFSSPCHLCSHLCLFPREESWIPPMPSSLHVCALCLTLRDMSSREKSHLGR